MLGTSKAQGREEEGEGQGRGLLNQGPIEPNTNRQKAILPKIKKLQQMPFYTQTDTRAHTQTHTHSHTHARHTRATHAHTLRLVANFLLTICNFFASQRYFHSLPFCYCYCLPSSLLLLPLCSLPKWFHISARLELCNICWLPASRRLFSSVWARLVCLSVPVCVYVCNQTCSNCQPNCFG